KLGGTFQHAVTLAVDAVENLATMNLVPSSLETLQSLKDAGYRIGIISDTWPYIERRIHAFKLDEYVDQYTYSYELGVLKPDVHMFQDALEKSGLKPEECIFIDDQVKNLEAAKSLGIHPVQIIYHEGIEIGEYPTIQKPSDILNMLKQYQ
ncbi:MAG: HAD-IA family hydrolase, partial [Solobacterium sp.]|nr:HAD-IA family hydrolase [Solobacterium sp.]